MTLPLPESQLQFISPQDRIDVIATFDGAPPKEKEKTGFTLLQNVQVLAVRPPVHPQEPGSLELALNPNEAQYLAVAIEQNSVHVALRNKNEVEMHPMEFVGFRKLFK